jgi:hypothetical protein
MRVIENLKHEVTDVLQIPELDELGSLNPVRIL